MRDGWDAATQAARRTRDGYGLDTGRFGHWLYAARVWCESAWRRLRCWCCGRTVH
ncbi:MAG: hypothetical protein R2703_05335 [Micropruina glycogenica]